MSSNVAMTYRNPATVRKAGFDALTNELGTVGAAYFMRQFTVGSGDYTAERNQHLEGITLDEIIANVRSIDTEAGGH